LEASSPPSLTVSKSFATVIIKTCELCGARGHAP
jgi:hypothetical protein